MCGAPIVTASYAAPSRTTVTSNQTYSYDAQRRLTRIVSVSDVGASTTQVFIAWDAFGRPTAGADPSGSFAYSYDDIQRVATITNLSGPVIITQTFDTNGIQI